MTERQGRREALVSTCQMWELGIGEDIESSWPDGLTCLCLTYVWRAGGCVGRELRPGYNSISVAVVVECQNTVP